MKHKLKTVSFQAEHAPFVAPEVEMELFKIYEQPNSYTVFVDDDVVACFGVTPQWENRGVAWALFNKEAGPHMKYITRQAREILDSIPGRIELTVVVDYEIGHKWAEMLGFHIETPIMRQYGPDGNDHTGYVRFN